MIGMGLKSLLKCNVSGKASVLAQLQPAANLFDEIPQRNHASLNTPHGTYVHNREGIVPARAPVSDPTKRTLNLFDEMPQRNHQSLNALLSTYARSGDANAAWELFCHMHRTGYHLNGYTFTPVLSACAAITIVERGRQVHNLVAKSNSISNSETVVGTALVDMYSKCGHLDDAIRAFEEVKSKDVVAWNTMLACFVRHGFANKAIGVFQEMQNVGVEISGFSLCSMLKACASSHALRQGEQVHASATIRGCNLLVFSTALIDFYSDCRMLCSAIKVFNDLNCKKDDAICNALVSGCVHNLKYSEAFSMLGRMKPNPTALTSVLVGCSELSNLENGKQIHCVAIRWGFESDTLLCNALLDMYAKCGKITNARLVFDRINVKNVVSWTSIIDAYGSHGRGIEALKLFDEMEKEPNSVSPNSVTFLAVLSACGHSGLLEEGRNCFVSMVEKHRIKLGPEHYACFIDLLGRAGKTAEAWDLFDAMVKSDTATTSAVWAALLNACRVNQDVMRGEFAAKHLLELGPGKPENYVLLSNFYAAIGKWDAVEELRRLMREKGLRKEVGSSWIALACENGGVAVDMAMEMESSHMT